MYDNRYSDHTHRSNTDIDSMYFINVTKFLDMEKAMRTGGQVDNSIEVLPYFDDESSAKINEYAILSHRWTQEEVNYVEMTGLAKMEEGERNKIRQRKGYHKISKGCELAGEDGYAWLWVDTCCIDKRSSAELSEAINSMYRWYQNSAVCYAHLHDVDGSFPTNPSEYWQFNGWPEWFSRGWTLQEMIAPDHLRFYNKNWKHIGDKKMLAHTLAGITGVPARVLADGLASNRPCVAQIMSWAANRTTSRVEDRAYSLLGLLDVNMPMLYGEGKKSFHRLQLEIIRMSNDQSIFAWSFSGEMGRTGCILADSPDFFRDCSQMELMKPDEFVQNLRFWLTETIEYFEPGILQQLHSVDKDLFGVYPVTNRGIHIWLPLSICIESPTSVFTAWLPCRSGSSDAVGIHLAVWESNYYRYHTTRPIGPPRPQGRTLELRQLHLRYQDMPHRDMIFEIDDRDIIEKGFTHCGVVPSHLTGKTKMITSNDLPCTIVYSDHRTNNNFAVGIGQCFDQDWMEVIYGQRTAGIGQLPSETYEKMVMSGPEHSKTMAEARSEGQCLTIMQSRPPWRSRWTVRTSCMVWEKSRKWRCGIKLETFEDSGFHNNLDKWTGFNVEVNGFANIFSLKFILTCLANQPSSHYARYAGSYDLPRWE